VRKAKNSQKGSEEPDAVVVGESHGSHLEPVNDANIYLLIYW
jgi:hypothetical protein